MNQPNDTEKLTKAIENLDDHVEDLIKEEAFWRSFVKGVIGSVGAAIGATLIIAIIVLVLQKLSGVPIIGNVVHTVLSLIQQKK